MIARFSGPKEWTDLMMNPTIGKSMNSMPTGTLLHILADEGEEKTYYEKYSDSTQEASAKAFIDTLSPTQQ